MAGKRYKPDGPSAEERALERFTELMIKKISSIKGDWKKPWFTENFMAWPKNLSGREYNGMNALMLMLLCEENNYKLPVFCTFQRVSGLNYSTDRQGNHKPLTDANGERLPQVSVLKGEKSFPVFITTFTVVNKETKEKIKMEDYRKLSPEEQSHLWQCCNKHYPDVPKKSDTPTVFFQSSHPMGQTPFFHRPGRLGVLSCSVHIASHIVPDVLPEKSQFINGESFYGTLLHEMTHSTGAEGRLDRIKPAAFGSKEYAREELVAELGSALVASQYGITKTIKEDSAQYLGSWLDVLKESPEFLKTTLLDVKKASSMIAQRIDAVAEKMGAKERMFYSSVAYLQFSDDTGQFDELKEKGDYEGLLALGREYYDGNGINEKYTYLSPLQNKGDDLLIEDKDFAVVYNGSAGGTYEVMLKFTEQEIRDHIKRYGVDIAGETIKEVARNMVAEQFDRLPRSPVFEMASGDILYLEYNREKEMLMQ